MREWVVDKVKNQVSLLTDYVANGSFASLAENVTYYNSENYAYLIRLTDYNNGFEGDFVYVDEHSYNFLAKSKLFGDEIIISNVGAYAGTTFLAPKLDKPMTLGPNAIMLNFQSGNKFYYYWFRSPLGKHALDGIISGSAQPKFNKTSFKELEIPIPPLAEQKAIASVLSSLDDKIDLLHRQNKTLEAMAETLFRQWFIEEAKEDWKDGVLEQLIDLKYGKALKQEHRSGSGYPVVASSGIVGFHKDYLVQAPGIVIGRKGTLGKVYFMEDNFYPIDTSYFIQSKTSGSNLIFEYYLLKSLDFANMNSDSAVPGLNRNIALSTQIQIPPKELILNFNETAQPWFSKIHSNTKQIQTLENLRDTLLPKLMSGEVRVQYQTEEVA